jgi:hypothetical protein
LIDVSAELGSRRSASSQAGFPRGRRRRKPEVCIECIKIVVSDHAAKRGVPGPENRCGIVATAEGIPAILKEIPHDWLG